MRPVPVTAVQGTWGWRWRWWQDGSEFWRCLAPHGLVPARILDGKPFEWETGLGSSLFFWRRWGWGDKGVEAWRYAGIALAYYLAHLPYEDRVVVGHSHGGQPALFCAAEGVPIKRLLTIGTPVRADMQDVIRRARPNLGTWWHVASLEQDWTAVWGRFGDGAIGGGRQFRAADMNILIPGIGHSELFLNQSAFHVWHDQQLIPFLRGDDDDARRPDHAPRHDSAWPAHQSAA